MSTGVHRLAEIACNGDLNLICWCKQQDQEIYRHENVIKGIGQLDYCYLSQIHGFTDGSTEGVALPSDASLSFLSSLGDFTFVLLSAFFFCSH